MMRYQQTIAALQHVVWSDQWCLMVNEVSGVPNEDVRSWVSVNEFTRLVGRPAYKIHPALAVLELLPRRSPCDRRVFVYNPEWAEPVRKRIDTVRRIEFARRKMPLAEEAEEQGDLLTLGEFKARVGAGAVRTRAALGVLDYQPLRLLADLRHTRYSALWVHPVREWLRTTGKQNRLRVCKVAVRRTGVDAGDAIRWVS